jgi:predicted extracellular nuclease
MKNSRFKAGTFNLYNLSLPDKWYYPGLRYTQEEYQKKADWVAEQLRRMDADIVGFQEVFDAEALQQVLDASGRYRDATCIVGEQNGVSPAVGLVSCFPVLEYTSIPNFSRKAWLSVDESTVPIHEFSRPVLRVKVELHPGIEVIVFVVHLKSKNPLIDDQVDRHDPVEHAIGKAKSLVMRTCEATALRCILLETIKGNDRPVMVIGDINDTSTAVSSEIIMGSPPWRKLKHKQKREIWDTMLYNVKDLQARQSYQNTYYTHIHNGYYESLDHILVSQEFIRQNPEHIGQIEYVAVLNDHLIDETLSEETIPRWQSDHGQVVATIRLERGTHYYDD